MLLIGGSVPTETEYMDAFICGSRLSEDGRTVYMIFTCKNIEYLADHDLYVSIHDRKAIWRSSKNNTMWVASENDPEDENAAYYYDPDTGIYTRNEEYNGFNALFRVPVDSSKADPEMAQAIKNVETDENRQQAQEKIFDFLNQKTETVILTSDNYQDLAEPVEGTRAVLIPDEDGNVLVPGYKIYDHEGGDVVMMVTDHKEPFAFYMDYYFKNSEPGQVIVVPRAEMNEEDQIIKLYEILTLNEDESITYEVYEMRIGQ